MLAWESSYKIGQKEMDGEHLVLFSLLNQLNINIDADLTEECAHDILSALTAYMDYHFSHEEALMRAAHYPDLESHIATHRAFSAAVAKLSAQLSEKEPLQVALKVRSFVLEWLLGHILEIDAQYAKFMAQ